MTRPIDRYSSEDLRVLADRFEKEGFFALLDITFVDRSTDPDHEEKSTEKIAVLSDVVADVIRFTAEMKDQKPQQLTIGERSTITGINNHLKTIEYQSTSATYIHRLLKIIERLTDVVN